MILAMIVLFLMAPPLQAERSTESAGYLSLNPCCDRLLIRLAEAQTIRGLSASKHDAMTEGLLEREPNILRKRLSVEEALSLNPEKIFVGPFDDPQLLNMLERMGQEVIRVPVPENFDQLFDVIGMVAQNVGQVERGDALISDLKFQLDQSLRTLKDAPRLKALFRAAGGHVPAGDTYEDAILEAAGAVNVASSAGLLGHHWISIEQTLLWRPDFLVVRIGEEKRDSVSYDEIFHPAIVRFVGQKRIIQIPADMMECAGVESLDVVRMIREKNQEWLLEKDYV